jgi:UDP-N-acetylmuramate--alanine ligase
LNASAALVVADLLGLPLVKASEALSTFNGTGRRFEIMGEFKGVIIVSDYAHHPTEIKATLSAARVRYAGRHIWAVWQPHTYSRTRMFFDAFANSFQDADHVLITEIYPARESFDRSYSAGQFLDAMTHQDVYFQSGISEAADFLIDNIKTGDVVIVLSAGDADQICTQLIDALERAPQENG